MKFGFWMVEITTVPGMDVLVDDLGLGEGGEGAAPGSSGSRLSHWRVVGEALDRDVLRDEVQEVLDVDVQTQPCSTLVLLTVASVKA
jgi:hypothetical protein